MSARTTRRQRLGSLALSCMGAVFFASLSASAQDGDVRMIRPDVMILLDTSGSMEWRVGALDSTCIGADGGPCNQCSNGASMCSPSCPVIEQQNRWATAIQVLTGTIQNFSCTELPRNDASIYTYDYLYPIPYHEPLSGGFPLWDSRATGQMPDGILDTYADRVRFGLMTFDNDVRTGVLANDGLFSYGPNRAFLANGCMAATTPVNLGARRASIDNNVNDIVPGGLVSVGPPSADSVTLQNINQAVQTAITGRANAIPLPPTSGARPYGGTPIAALLEDSYYYWTTNPDVTVPTGSQGDPYYACRARYNILITDGYPNMDFRPACQGGGGVCPYPTPDQTALQLTVGSGSGPGVKTFVIAFNATDIATLDALRPIAIAGGTMDVLSAMDRTGLQTALSRVLDTIASQTSTRTAPAFGQSASSSTNQTLFQFQSSFAVAAGYPWEGILERRRTLCQGSPPVPVDQNVVQSQDDFGYLLQASQRAGHGWGPRHLWTWVPPTARTAAQMQETMAWTAGQPTRFDLDASVNPALFNAPTPIYRDTLVAWLRGDAGTVRQNRPLGDIFHSNPLVWGAPLTSLPDQTFSAFRQLTLSAGGWRTTAKTVGTRETAVYVGSNDGILHAFNADTGEEMWGFVPPYLTGSIASMYPSNHQYGVDGSPVAREVLYQRSPTNLGTATGWHSILLVGLRGGGGAYEALDVTDPYNPAFLWQFTDAGPTGGTDPHLVNAYGTPTIATIFTNWQSGASIERAVAILPGGQGSPLPAGMCTSALGVRPELASSDTRISHAPPAGAPRARVRCWQGTTGQYLYVVDLQTGQLIRSFGPTGSPVVGSPALYLGTPGAIATRAYVGDADGGVWQLDMSNPNPNNWRFSLVFDTFWDAPQMEGQPIVAPPVVSLDTNGDTLITVGSGDPDLLEGVDHNRIAAYRETIATDTSGAVTGIRVANIWQISTGTNTVQGDLYPGERLTGPISLFNGALYFGTFVPANSTDACQMGFSRLWGVSLTSVSGARPDAKLDLDGNPSTTTDVVRVTQDINGDGSVADDQNSVLFGVGIVRRPSCVTTQTTADPYLGGTHQWVDQVNGGDFRLVAQTGRGGTPSGGSRTTVVSRVLPPPVTQAQISAWATVFE